MTAKTETVLTADDIAKLEKRFGSSGDQHLTLRLVKDKRDEFLGGEVWVTDKTINFDDILALARRGLEAEKAERRARAAIKERDAAVKRLERCVSLRHNAEARATAAEAKVVKMVAVAIGALEPLADVARYLKEVEEAEAEAHRVDEDTQGMMPVCHLTGGVRAHVRFSFWAGQEAGEIEIDDLEYDDLVATDFGRALDALDRLRAIAEGEG